ncbi:hypothetical protein SAMN06265360_11970 [Haloechinothrix alba]|uniref:DUF4345 domain-containing protein n=1 Tax=Haloechinothrix alba TaxID=664784 RepID=A0A238Z7C1_9PSEU|nr:hypothetical protein [Haloechinothrix alba]SNR78821.1 hypothetical protein SAMN06265360_11970 [Haloechinothrix alba]
MTEPRWHLLLTALGGGYLALALWAALHPVSFETAIADFGPTNVHLLRDFGACAATFGIGLLLARNKPHWRPPVLAMAAVWNGLHAVSHIVHVTEAHPAIIGPAEAVALVGVTVLFAWLARASTATRPKERPHDLGK